MGGWVDLDKELDMKKALLFISFSAFAFSSATEKVDVVKLKDGSVLEGKIVEKNFTDCWVKLELVGNSGSTMHLTLDKIESIDFHKNKKSWSYYGKHLLKELKKDQSSWLGQMIFQQIAFHATKGWKYPPYFFFY